MGPERPRLLPAFLLSAYTVLVAAFASLPLTETAAVKVTAPPQRVESNVLINIAAQHIDAQVTDSQQGATSTAQAAAQTATGLVTFYVKCPPATLPCKPVQSVPAGTVVYTAKLVRFSTEAAVHFTGTTGSVTAPVKAIAPGSSGNTAVHTITLIDKNPYPGELTVDNPQYPTAGGADPRVTQVVQQSDLDSVERILTAKIADELASALKTKAPAMDFVVDGPPTFDIHSDHAVGDAAPVFTMTITGSVGAVAFSDSAAQALVRTALQPIVQPGYALTSDPIQSTFLVTQVINNGTVTVRVAAVTVATPTALSAKRLNARLAGLSLRDAHNELQRDFPGSQVDIRLKPLSLPWLPPIADHISLTLIVGPANG